MRIYEFIYDTGPFENDISFKFHLKKDEKLNGNFINKAYHCFKYLVDKEIESTKQSLDMFDKHDDSDMIEYIESEISRLNKILEEAVSLCRTNKWQDFYDSKKERIIYPVSKFERILITSEIIIEF